VDDLLAEQLWVLASGSAILLPDATWCFALLGQVSED